MRQRDVPFCPTLGQRDVPFCPTLWDRGTFLFVPLWDKGTILFQSVRERLHPSGSRASLRQANSQLRLRLHEKGWHKQVFLCSCSLSLRREWISPPVKAPLMSLRWVESLPHYNMADLLHANPDCLAPLAELAPGEGHARWVQSALKSPRIFLADWDWERR